MSIELEVVKKEKLRIFQISAPDSSYDDIEIDLFYVSLQQKINNLPNNTNYVILNDFNAKVGKNADLLWPAIARIYGLGKRNEQGERLLQFCAINNLAIMNTMFKHKPSRHVTWISPDGKTKNQIDYIICQQKVKSLFKNCRVFPSADVYSDHLLLAAVIEVKPPKVKRLSTIPKKYDLDKLRDKHTAEAFEQRLGGRFEPLLGLEDGDVDNIYDQFKTATNKTTEEVVAFRRRKQLERMTKELIN